jgi:hypothetical protein
MFTPKECCSESNNLIQIIVDAQQFKFFKNIQFTLYEEENVQRWITLYWVSTGFTYKQRGKWGGKSERGEMGKGEKEREKEMRRGKEGNGKGGNVEVRIENRRMWRGEMGRREMGRIEMGKGEMERVEMGNGEWEEEIREGEKWGG